MERKGIDLCVMVVLLFMVSVVIIAPIAQADCPDILNCYGPNPGAEQLRWVGSFGTGSCWSWRWWTCAPWHCQGNTTSKEYWEDKCNKTFVGCQGKCKVRVDIEWSWTWPNASSLLTHHPPFSYNQLT